MILEQFINDVGVDREHFLEVVKAGVANKQHKRIFEQLLLIENFQVFKKLMVKRNKTLELECMKQLKQGNTQAQGDKITNLDQSGAITNQDYQRMLLEKE